MVISRPVVTVTDGGGAITDGQATAVSFGSTNVGGATPSLSFTVKNTGGSSLTLSGLSVPSGYTITTNLTSPLASGGSESFVVRLDATTPGTKTGSISFANNDPSRNPFNFPVTGTVTGQAPPAAPTNLTVTTLQQQFCFLELERQFEQRNRICDPAAAPDPAARLCRSARPTPTSPPSPTPALSGPSANTSYYYHVEGSDRHDSVEPEQRHSADDFGSNADESDRLDGESRNDVTLSWNPVPGVNKYAVYRSTLNDPNTGSSIGPATTNSFDDTSAGRRTRRTTIGSPATIRATSQASRAAAIRDSATRSRRQSPPARSRKR